MAGTLASGQFKALLGGGLLGAGVAISYILLKADVVLKPFSPPQEGEYLGNEDKASLIYDGKEDYQKLTLETKWKTLEFHDLSR